MGDPLLEVDDLDPVVPWNIVRVAHVELHVADLDRSREFYVDLLGLTVTEESDDALYLRGYEDRVHHCLVLRRGPIPLATHVGFRVSSPADLDLLRAYHEKLGCPTRELAAGEERAQGPALRLLDPASCPIEYFYEMAPAERLLQRFDLYRGPYIMRLDHINLHLPDVLAAYGHYRRLGYRCSEYTVTDPPEERMWGAWMYRKPGVHDVAYTHGAGPRLHHLAFWLYEPSGVIRACDVLAAAGYGDQIERGPGRHGVSNAFFVYLRDPDGHRVELFTGDYYTGDPDFEPIRWTLNDPRRATFWGHFAPASWFEESSLFAGLDGEPIPLEPERFAARTVTAT